MVDERLLVIDTDAGVDDALALLIALRAHKEPHIPWKILAITCVHGNTSLDHVCTNVNRIVQTAGLGDEIPIYRGAPKPMVHRTARRWVSYHGEDGFGDCDDLPPIETKIEDEHAVTALIRLAHENEGNLTVITLGPLTNIALAIDMDPTFSKSLKELCLMGGNIWGMGNISVCAEFNFWADPEAVHVVLVSEYRNPILMVPWETCKIEARLPLEWRTDVLGKVETKEAQLLNQIEKNILKRNELIHMGWVACDALVPAAMLSARLTNESQNHFCRIELNGIHTRGQTVLDHPRLTNEKDNTVVVTKVNLDEFKDIILWGVYGRHEDLDFCVNNHVLFPV